MVSTDGELGIFASRRKNAGLNLCTYTLPADLKPDPVTVVKAIWGGRCLKELTVSIEYVQSKRVEQVTYSKEDGQFAHIVQLEDGEDVVLTVQGENVGYQSVVVHEQGTDAASAVALDLAPPAKLEAARKMTRVRRATLLSWRTCNLTPKKAPCPNARRSSCALANHLERQPELRLDIDGHTDDIGEAQDNLVLSQSRAEVVKTFLMTCGVNGDRMTTQGHGEAQPKTTNATPEGRRVNRRTEFRWMD